MKNRTKKKLKKKGMVVKVAGKDYPYLDRALTLNPDFVRKEQESGWVITGKIQEDYYEWINEFVAEHTVYGKIYGDFEKIVIAESEESFQHFWDNHEPDSWDYWDI